MTLPRKKELTITIYILRMIVIYLINWQSLKVMIHLMNILNSTAKGILNMRIV